jgi:hypothetical protein
MHLPKATGEKAAADASPKAAAKTPVATPGSGSGGAQPRPNHNNDVLDGRLPPGKHVQWTVLHKDYLHGTSKFGRAT